MATDIPLDKEIMILRQRFIVDYTSHSEKQLQEEFTLKCITDLKEGIDNIFIRSPKFLPNLKIYDFDGAQLSLLTNRLTRALLTSHLKKATSDSEKNAINKLLVDMTNHEIYIFWIKLPHSRKFFSNESRVITLEYQAPKEDVEENERVMEFHSAPYEVFYNVTPPEDFEFDTMELRTIDSKTKKVKKTETTWKSKKGDPYYFTESQHSISVRISPNFPDHYLFVYSFKPKKTLTNLPRLTLGILIAGSIVIFLSNFVFFSENCNAIQLCWITTPVEGKQSDFVIAITAASLIIPRLIRNVEIRDRMKYRFLIPIAIAIIGLYV